MKESDMRDTVDTSPTPEYLNAFLDGELTAGERAHVMSLLESDPAFKARACEMRTLKEMVRGAYGEVPAAPTRTRRPTFHGVPQAMAAGVLLVLGLGAGWMARDLTAAPAGYDRLAGLPEGYQAIALSERVDSGKIILHLDSGEPGRLSQVLDLADRLLERQPSARIEIVANSYGLDLLRADVTPLRERIENMARRHANLSFVACGQTVARLTREGVKVDLLPVAHTATSAINAIMTRMGQGWVYVKV
jgi:intracellular sulfur oxidation DsrE/DsrF family protein